MATNKWLAHVKKVKAEKGSKGLPLKDILKKAKKTYKK